MSEAAAAGHDAPTHDTVDAYVRTVTGEAHAEKRSWFHKLVTSYLKYHYRGGRTSPMVSGATERARAESVIRRSCIKSALTGAGASIITTGATIVTAETALSLAAITVPVAASAIGGEMLYRALIHIEMTCDLADIFGVHFNPDEPKDLWRLLGLAFRSKEHEHDDDPGQSLVSEVVEEEEHTIGKEIGSELLGESVLRNVVPFVGIALSSVQNWRLTRRVGDTVRRYVRYQRALADALHAGRETCRAHTDLLAEGLWYVFTADGNLNPEETAVLAEVLDDLAPEARAEVVKRFTLEDEAWLERLKSIGEAARTPFYNALAVAAAVDKKVSLPEQKLLKRAAQTLGQPFEMARVEAMMRQFEDRGVLEMHHK